MTHRIWPGAPYPIGATWDGAGRQLRPLLGARDGGRAVPLRRPEDGVESAADRAARAHRLRLARLLPRRAARASSTATGCTARTSPSRATASTRTSSCSTRTRGPSPARSTGTTRPRLHHRRPARGPLVRRRDSAPRMPKGVVVDPTFSWGDDRHPETPPNRTIIYETHVRGMTMRHPGCREELRGTYLGARLGPDPRPPARPRRDRGGAPAGAPVRRRPDPARAGAAQLLGLQHDRLLRARGALRDAAATASRCTSSRRWSRRSTGRASRSSSTWSTTTPPRATTSARRSRSGASTTRATTGCTPTARATTSTSPAPATAST